jgi:hypothetical protein
MRAHQKELNMKIILALILLLASHAFSQDLETTSVALNLPELKAIKEDSVGFDQSTGKMLEICALLGQDEFEYTLPNLDRQYTHAGTEYREGGEANSIASTLFKDHLYAISYTLGAGAYCGVALVLGQFDKDHLGNIPIRTQDIFLIASIALEVYSIHLWKSQWLGPQEQMWPLINLPV